MGGMALSVKPAKVIQGYKEHQTLVNSIVNGLMSRGSPFYARNNAQHERVLATKIFTGPALSHSDVDFVIMENYGISAKHPTHAAVNSGIATILGSKEFVTNGDVTSFEFREYQVDFIRLPTNPHLHAPLDWGSVYYGSKGAISSIINPILKPYDLKFSLKGLEYQHTYKGKKLGWIPLHNVDNVMNMIGSVSGYFTGSTNFCYTCQTGYAGEAALFDDIKKFPYLTKEALGMLEDGSVPELSRRTAGEWDLRQRFINYCLNDRKFIAQLPQVPTKDQINSLTTGLNHINAVQFFREASETQARKINVEENIKKKFNGGIIKNISDIEGPQLGRFLGYLKNQYPTERLFDRFILSSLPQTIEVFVEKHKVAFLEYDAAWVKAMEEAERVRLEQERIALLKEQARKEAEELAKQKALEAEKEAERLKMQEVAERTKARLIAKREKEQAELEAKMKLAVAMPPLPEPIVRAKKVVNLPPIPESVDHPRTFDAFGIPDFDIDDTDEEDLKFSS
jgi:hypothetical protein